MFSCCSVRCLRHTLYVAGGLKLATNWLPFYYNIETVSMNILSCLNWWRNTFQVHKQVCPWPMALPRSQHLSNVEKGQEIMEVDKVAIAHLLMPLPQGLHL